MERALRLPVDADDAPLRPLARIAEPQSSGRAVTRHLTKFCPDPYETELFL
jgi:hypothetical protein